MEKETGAQRGKLRNRMVCLEPQSHHDAVQIQLLSTSKAGGEISQQSIAFNHLFALNAVAADYGNIIFYRQNIKLKRLKMVN